MKSHSKIKNNLIVGIILSFLLISCEDNSTHHELSFDLQLKEDGRGYHHLTLDRDNWQTLHKITGSIRDEGFGVENFWVEWESNLYWYIGDTLGYVVSRGLDMNLQYVNYDTTYLTQFNGLEVPTSNQMSYSNYNGTFHNMIAPVNSMMGDTMKLTAYWYDGSRDFYIVLD